jgi:hypothetical protein
MDPEQTPRLPRPRSEIVEFDGDRLVAVILEGDGVAVPLRLIWEAMGLDHDAQSQRIREHEVLSQGLRVVNARIGNQVRSVLALLHTYIPFYLATISPHQVAEAVRPKLIRYQQELVTVLARLYLGDSTPITAPSPDPAVAQLQQRLEAALRELKLARDAYLAHQQQSAVQLDDHERRLTELSDIVEDLQQVVRVSAEQAAYIQRTIKSIAQRYKNRTGADIFGKLFAEFTMALGTPRYDALPARKFDEAVAWLEQRAAELLPGDDSALPPRQERLL